MIARLSAALVLALAGAVAAETAPSPAPAKDADRPRIDVAFCIDTTGSMQPYIDATKKKVWDIANGLLTGKPRPIVRLAVVAYRDINEEYLTQDLDLTDDIDRVHSYLMGLKAAGGGDEPEHVTAGLRDCVDKLSWSSGKRVLKAIYLIGDAPAHVDYADGDYKPWAKKAVSMGINIHTLACAGGSEVAQWQEIARLTDGQFIQLPHIDRFAARRKTPLPPGVSRVEPEASLAEREAATDSGATSKGLSTAGARPVAPAMAPAPEDAVGDKILDSLKSEAKKKGVAEY